jgi:hypothetical protein
MNTTNSLGQGENPRFFATLYLNYTKFRLLTIMQRPLDFILQTVKKSVDSAAENEKSNFETLEKLYSWVIGFSLAAFAFIVSKISDLQSIYGHGTLKAILILLCVSILVGIIHRFAFVIWRTYLQILNRNFQMMFADQEDIVEIDAQDVSQQNDIKEVIRLFHENFGQDLSYLLPIYETADEGKKILLLNDVKKHYQHVHEWAKRDYQNAIELVKDYYKEAYGASDKEADKILNADVKGRTKVAKTIFIIALYLSFISFLTSITILVIKF